MIVLRFIWLMTLSALLTVGFLTLLTIAYVLIGTLYDLFRGRK